MNVAIELIDVGTRLRGATPETVASLAASIGDVGLLHPITVYVRPVIRGGVEVSGYGIVAGLHRFEACRKLGMDEISVHVVTLGDLERQIAECDENLCGTKLTPSERALFTMRRKQAYEALHPETRHGTNQHERSGKVCHSSFTDDTASKTGQSERAIRLDATRGARIDADVLDQVRGTDMDKGVTLDALAALPKEQQEAELRRLVEARTKPAPAIKNAFESEEDWRRALFTVWNRGAQDWRERALETIDSPTFDKTSSGRAA